MLGGGTTGMDDGADCSRRDKVVDLILTGALLDSLWPLVGGCGDGDDEAADVRRDGRSLTGCVDALSGRASLFCASR